MGQHFLADPRVAARIAAAVANRPERVCLEVGPGLGALTAALTDAGRRVVAVEIDRGLAAFVRDLAGADGAPVTVVEGDARTVDLAGLSAPADTLFVGNLPYYASSPLLRRALALGYPAAVVMVQREVAGRLVAPPGRPRRSGLTVLREAVCAMEVLFSVPPEAFYPRPEVESAVVRLTRRPDALAGAAYARLERALRAGFGHRRKGMRQALRHGTALSPGEVEAALARAGVEGQRRPETLSLAEWDALARALEEEGGEGAWRPEARAGS